MPRKLMWVEYGDDEELSNSRKHPGKQSPLTRDLDGELGHVVLDDVSDDDLVEFGSGDRPSDDDDSFNDDSVDQGIENVILVLTFLVEVVSPHVHAWWKESGRTAAREAARSAKNRFVARVRHRRTAPDSERGAGIDTTEPCGDTDANRSTLTVDEASRLLKDALTAAAFAQHQMNLLKHAIIVDDGSSPALADALRNLGSGNVDEVIAMLREADPVAVSEMVLATRPRPLPRSIELPAPHESQHRPSVARSRRNG